MILMIEYRNMWGQNSFLFFFFFFFFCFSFLSFGNYSHAEEKDDNVINEGRERKWRWVGSLCKGAPKCAIRIRSSFPWLVIGSILYALINPYISWLSFFPSPSPFNWNSTLEIYVPNQCLGSKIKLLYIGQYSFTQYSILYCQIFNLN